MSFRVAMTALVVASVLFALLILSRSGVDEHKKTKPRRPPRLSSPVASSSKPSPPSSSFLSAAFGCSKQRTSSSASSPIRVALIGDSHIAGFNASTHKFNGVFVQHLQQRIASGNGNGGGDTLVRSFALGTSGLTVVSPKLYQSTPLYESAVKFRPHVLVFEFGTNDASKARAFVGRAAFVQSYEKVLEPFLLESGTLSAIVFVTPPPLVPDCAPPMYCVGVNGTSLQQNVVPLIRVVAASTAKRWPAVEVRVVDFNRVMLRKFREQQLEVVKRELYQWDGMHLTQAGSELMAELVWKEARCGE